MTLRAVAGPRPTRGGAQIVDDAVFRLLIDMEIQKAQRLRYLVSVVCIHLEAETGTADASAAVKMLASIIRSTDAVTARDGSTVALLLIDADAPSLPTILQRLEVTALEALPWSAGGACYPQTAASAEELLSQALAMMARAKQDGGRRFYIPTTIS
jgi:hypothetical protein